MKKILALAIISSFFAFNANANSVAILDVEKIVKESKAMRYIQSKVSKQQEKYPT